MTTAAHGLAYDDGHGPDDFEVRWRGIHGWAITAFFLLWEALYQLCKLVAARRGSQWVKVARLGGSYLTAFLNACICSVLGLWILLAYLLFAGSRERALVLDDGPAVGVVYIAAQSFMGWLLMDCVHLLTHFPTLGGVDMVLHHVAFLITAALGYGYRVVPFVCGWLLLGEVSSVPLNIRWYLIQSGRGESHALTLTNYSFAVCFFVCRILLLNAGLVDLFVELRPVLLAPPCNAEAWAVNTFCALLVGCSLLNMYWMGKIVQMATKSTTRSSHGAGDKGALVIRGKSSPVQLNSKEEMAGLASRAGFEIDRAIEEGECNAREARGEFVNCTPSTSSLISHSSRRSSSSNSTSSLLADHEASSVPTVTPMGHLFDRAHLSLQASWVMLGRAADGAASGAAAVANAAADRAATAVSTGARTERP
uniref:TLC domain-containing protein n=1 Tax=Haptolina brevifila TaxID=156173 RepID=A0A7S2JKM7_9EUKA|mmetsp:Transcript_84741/g.169262  ORF Transcript_84741/g.169262 Transcript_84741/m.169262 type:complete len:423 (+) Transcript_84741:130-1398(+)|eukprot:CAMPEP_0174699962 /NCGR_PEP_ID=MMETSP1094-20130205/5066_1 /TAXON_ID=156173 /ORGANISM="Chrysochromulina brevifilum, Strain UTEX LB 985" /LENGTH=422 /DNA_ID=CAMNT_0015897375 /DNA_START=53 /DNA_END=1321 /DNA_ORIENTATION=+